MLACALLRYTTNCLRMVQLNSSTIHSQVCVVKQNVILSTLQKVCNTYKYSEKAKKITTARVYNSAYKF